MAPIGSPILRHVVEHGLPYVETAWASVDRVDSYVTRMRPSSLKNYAEGAAQGLSVQNSHRANELPLSGPSPGGIAWQPVADGDGFSIPPGLRVTDVDSSDVSAGI